MIINNYKDFESLFNKTFNNIDRDTLSKIGEDKRLRIGLGGEQGDENHRIKQASYRSEEILRYCFAKKSIWFRIIFWSNNEERNLIATEFIISKATNSFTHEQEHNTKYVRISRYSTQIVSAISTAIINFDLAREPSADITCYMINFPSKLIINIYDDRGLDIYTPDKNLLKRIKSKFFDWII